MTNKIVIGSGGCGFLRIYSLLKKAGFPVKYKGGQVKFQNGFQTWNPNVGLVWNTNNLSENEKRNRARYYLNSLQNHIDISHAPLPYVPELISLDPNIKIACLLPSKRHSINSLFTSWAYRNPIKQKRNEYRTRYVLDQFPDHSDLDYYEATQKYWEEYYSLAIKYSAEYPNNFLIVPSPMLFDPERDNYDTRKKLSSFFDNKLIETIPSIPVDPTSNIISTSLHGGLGNTLFQMIEPIVFANEFNLPKPIFGTWKLQNGGGIFPEAYNADKFLGGHFGTSSQMTDTFKNLNWKTELLEPNYDVKFVINDMFDFSKIHHMRKEILKSFAPTEKLENYINEKYGNFYNSKETISLHLRTCTLSADDHVMTIPFSFHEQALNTFPDDCDVLVFSDNNQIAKGYIEKLKVVSKKKFILIDENQFTTLFMIAKCNHHIMHISTFSFWGCYLDEKQEGITIYPKGFTDTHTDRIVPKELNWRCYE